MSDIFVSVYGTGEPDPDECAPQHQFELQHPLFMVLMAFAVTVTGGILRHRLIIIGVRYSEHWR